MYIYMYVCVYVWCVCVYMCVYYVYMYVRECVTRLTSLHVYSPATDVAVGVAGMLASCWQIDDLDCIAQGHWLSESNDGDVVRKGLSVVILPIFVLSVEKNCSKLHFQRFRIWYLLRNGLFHVAIDSPVIHHCLTHKEIPRLQRERLKNV